MSDDPEKTPIMTPVQKPDTKQHTRPLPNPLVEDATVEGGIDPTTGQATIRPKSADGSVREDDHFRPTDQRPESR